MSGGNYVASLFTTVPGGQTVLQPHSDSSVTTTNVPDKFYMMNDNSYTYSPTPCMASSCPTYTIDCYPPIDWSPKAYTFNLDTDPNPTSYDAPSVMDCLGRHLTVYDTGNNLRTPGGGNLDSTDSGYFTFTPSLTSG